MGLSLHWDLFAPAGVTAVEAAALVRSLREYAAGLPFGEVSEVVEAWSERTGGGGAGGGQGGDGEEAMAERAWALSQGLRVVAAPTDEDPGRTVRVAPVHVAAFRAYVAGAEEAAFGLACHGDGGAGGGGGYVWSAGCATQGAGRRGGAAAFLAAHRTVVSVLDKARSLGLRVSVRDDGGYWESRDPKVLLDRLAEWESLMTAIERGRRRAAKPTVLASEVREAIEARRRARPRLDRPPIEGLEG